MSAPPPPAERTPVHDSSRMEPTDQEPRRTAYGDHPDQWFETVHVAGKAGTAVLVHGGYWRERFTLELMRPLAAALHRAGWSTVNVEYRRGRQGPWPVPLQDVRAACTAAREAARTRTGPLIAVGHSVGGQLALLTGDPVAAVVALAPVTDAARTHREGLGEHAAAEYFQASPEQAPRLFADASALARLPVGRPTLLVHGADDDRVPVEHSLDFARAAWKAGDPVDLRLEHALGHVELIDPSGSHWPGALEWVRAAAGAATPEG